MSATTQDIFGSTARVEPATPGSYGLPPDGYRLPTATRLGAVRLQVAKLARSLAFYELTLGLRVIERDSTRATLAAYGDDRVLVVLEERQGTQPAGRRQLGLYHFAILLPDRASLGRFARHLAAQHSAAGSGDHLVSEALYLKDPDGLGIEVYADRPRDRWQRVGRELMIATDPVDIDGLIAAGGDTSWHGMPASTVIGHVHLHVGDLADGVAFFADGLGFDRMTWRYAGALFLGAGGYHHHLGTNVWAGVGAREPTATDARLLEWTIELPGAQDVADVSRNLVERGHHVDAVGDGEMLTRDPWGTAVRVRATDTAHVVR